MKCINRSKIKALSIAVMAALALAVPAAEAGELPPQPDSTVPKSAFFFGLGGSFSSVHFDNQNIYFKGVSLVYDSAGMLIGSGSAEGSIDPLVDRQFGMAPVVQAGYFRHFSNSECLWGAKFSYSYLGATSNKQNMLVPQAGSFSTLISEPFTGNEEVALFQTGINHQMNLNAFLGYSFEKSFIYLGVGATLSQTSSSLNGVVGFADIQGQHVSITGITTPQNFSNSQWVAGGDAVVGVTYFLTRSWFLDMSYTFGITENHTADFSAPFSNSTMGFSSGGTNYGTYSGHVLTQSFAITINKAF